VSRLTTSVIICAYTTDRSALVRSAVESAQRQMPAPDQIVLVVDHCAELESQARGWFAGSGVDVVANAGRQGLADARNTGVSRAHGDVVVFLDDDAAAEPGWLAGHLRAYTHAAVVGAGGVVLPEWECGEPSWFPREFGWVVGCSYVGLPDSATPIRNPIGANMSFRRHVIEEVGGFSAALGRVGAASQGCEETELSIRATRSVPGGRIMHEPSAVVRHRVPGGRGRWAYFRRRCWAEGLSKAQVTALAGRDDGLASERDYVRRTLPRGVVNHLGCAYRERAADPLARATAVLAGLTFTAAGYAAGRLRQQQRPHPANAGLTPAEVIT
jgi:glucosyl-dolichyl phosphate glucuronosyltransferase